MSFRPDITSEPSRTNLFFPRPQYMTLPEQQLDFNAGNIPSVMPQRGSSQVSEQQGIQTSTVASKASGKKPRERWSNEEHERFLEGLKMYNRDWKSIEKHVGTKTAVQIRSHAQKFFVKAEREPGTVDFELPPPRPKRKPASAANGNASKSAVSQAQTDAAPAVKASVPPPSGGPIPATNATALLGGLLPDTVSGPMQSLTGSTQLMNKIAAAAIAAATTTAHAVITAAGPEYLQVIQELAKHDQRLSFLACPLPELVSSFSRQPDGAERPSSKQLQTSEAPTSACPMSMPMKGGLGLTSIVNPSLPQPCMSEPPVQILNQLLSLPASSSQLVSEQLGPEMAQHRERLDMYGTVPSTTGMTGNMLLSHLNDSSTPEAATNTAPPLTTFTVPPPALPHINLPAPVLATGNKAQGPPYSAVEQPLHAVSMPAPSPPVSGQVQSMQHATPVPQNHSSAHATMPWHAVQLLQTQQQNQQHVFPKPGGLQAEELPATTTGYGQQGSGGGSGGNSGGEMNGSGDKSGSKSAKQSGNVKAPEMLEVLPCGNEGQAPECLPLGAVNDMPLLQPQGRLNSMQRAEFYKQYYHEMIRRGTEGLRNMNVDLGSDNMAWLGPDGAPVAGLPTPDTQPMNANKSPPGAELPASRRQECLPEAHGWTGRKKQRTADTLDVQKAALSNACEQPAAILGMVPCPPDASILPLESGRVLEFHKGTGWAIEVEQQDTATSAQGHSREGPGASRNTHPDTSHKLQTSPQKAHPEVSQGKDGPPPCRNRSNSSGEGSNEPGEGCNDGSGDGAKPEPGDANADDPALPEKGGEEFKQESTRSLMHHRVQRTTGA